VDAAHFDEKLEIYTIGHGNASAKTVIDLLCKYQIKTLVDVRSVPYSQYVPDFNREVFEKALQKAGISYAFAGEYLGGRPKDETCYKNQETPRDGTGRAKFLKLVDYDEVAKRPWYQKSIDRLLEIARKERTVIMCSEEDPSLCHRSHLIAQTLIRMGVQVKHIRRNANQETWDEQELPREKQPQQLSLF
jgi:uncharacterized protein (DUF488 family)